MFSDNIHIYIVLQAKYRGRGGGAGIQVSARMSGLVIYLKNGVPHLLMFPL